MVKKNHKSHFLLFFSLLYFTLLSSPYGMPGIGVDASWTEALVMTIDTNKTFGRDFIFNYGPLGYLNTIILPQKVSVYVLVLLNFFTLFNYLFIINLCFQKVGQNWKWAALAAVLIFIPWGFFADLSFTYFYFFLFWLLHAQQSQKPLGLIFATICAVLLFFVKVNLSLIVYGVFALTLIYFWIRKVFNFKTILTVFIALFGFTYVLSIVLNVDLVSYLSASIKIIDAYQDAMAVIYITNLELLFYLSITALIILAVCVLIIKNFKLLLNDKNAILLFLFVALAWFLNFKQSFTAISLLNLNGYHIFLPPLVVLLYLFTPAEMSKSVSRLFIIVFVLQLIAIQVIRFKSSSNYLLSFVSNDIKNKFHKPFNFIDFVEILSNKTPYNYIKNTVNYKYENNFETNLRPLPSSFLNKYKSTTIDIIPTEIDYVFFNRLRYNPRPVIQTYQANSDWLMKKNGEKYLSETAPQTVLYRLDSFREQNPFWVETDVTKALLRRYKITDSVKDKNNSFLIFSKCDSIKSIVYKQLLKSTFRFGEEIKISHSDKPVQMNINIEYSFLGKIIRLFFQPPYFYCNVTYKNGSKIRYRVIDKILKGGVLINKKVNTNADALAFFSNQNHKNLQVSSISFYTRFKWGFKPNFDGVFKEIIVE